MQNWIIDFTSMAKLREALERPCYIAPSNASALYTSLPASYSQNRTENALRSTVPERQQDTLKHQLQKQKQKYRDLKRSHRDFQQAHHNLEQDHWELGHFLSELQGDLSELKACYDPVMRSKVLLPGCAS